MGLENHMPLSQQNHMPLSQQNHLTRGTVEQIDLDHDDAIDANESYLLGTSGLAKEIVGLLTTRSTDDHSIETSYLRRLSRL